MSWPAAIATVDRPGGSGRSRRLAAAWTRTAAPPPKFDHQPPRHPRRRHRDARLSPAAVPGSPRRCDARTRINRSIGYCGSSAADFAIEGVGWTNPDCQRGHHPPGRDLLGIAGTERQRAQGTMVRRPFVLVVATPRRPRPARSAASAIWYAHDASWLRGDATAAVIDQSSGSPQPRPHRGNRQHLTTRLCKRTAATSSAGYRRRQRPAAIHLPAARGRHVMRQKCQVDTIFALFTVRATRCRDHGLCGYRAAESALRWLRKRRLTPSHHSDRR